MSGKALNQLQSLRDDSNLKPQSSNRKAGGGQNKKKNKLTKDVFSNPIQKAVILMNNDIIFTICFILSRIATEQTIQTVSIFAPFSLQNTTKIIY